MPGFHFPTKEEREALIRELQEKALSENSELAKSGEFEAYQNELTALHKLMSAYYQPGRDGIPKSIGEEDRARLLAAIQKTAVAGEKLLATASGVYHLNLQNGLPGVVNRLQNMFSVDFDTLENYDPKEKKTLPELQMGARTITINIRDRKLGTVGNMSSSRIPMTIVNAQGKKRTGVFTKASHVDLKDRFNRIIAEAKESCSEEGKKELDELLVKYRQYLINGKHHKVVGRVRASDSDDYVIGDFLNRLHYKMLTEEEKGRGGFVLKDVDEPTLKRFMKEAGINTAVLSKRCMKTLTEKLGVLSNSPVPTLQCVNLELKNGARLDNRNTAMSKVAGLLGVPKLLARSDNMKVIDENGEEKEGTFMDFGDGIDLMGHKMSLAAISSGQFDTSDVNKELFKQIADLQVLDYLCLNVDRHPGNLVYQVDENGKISGIQGIDNDDAFGLRLHDTHAAKDLRVISESMAQTIKNLTPEMLAFSLRGCGLSEEEIAMSTKRLQQLQHALDRGRLRQISDFSKVSVRELYPKDREGKNLFKTLDSTIPDYVRKYRNYFGKTDLDQFRVRPEFVNIKTTDRNYSVGGLRDSVLETADLVVNMETGFTQDDLVGVRGRSENFKNLMDSVLEAAKLQLTTMEQRDAKGQRLVDDHVRLNEVPALGLMAKVVPAFNDMEEKANTYLLGKMKARGAKSIEELVGKNEYEQNHIDYAKKVLKTVDQFRERIKAPELEEDKEAMRAQDDQQLIEEIRKAREAADKIREKQMPLEQPPGL